MTHTITTIPELAQHLTQGTVVLTPNQRLSAYIQREYQHYQQTRGVQSWPSTAILPLNAYLQETWLAYIDHSEMLLPPCLTHAAELALWEQVIQQAQEIPVLSLRQTAKQAANAWHIIHHWELPLTQQSFQDNIDTRTFYTWAQAFKTLCQQKCSITSAELLATLTHNIQANPTRLILAGFDDYFPALQRWLTTLKEQHTHIMTFNLSIDNTAVKQTAFATTEDEIKQMAAWAYNAYEQGANHIACVIPNLIQERDTVLRLFHTQMPADLINCSAGKPLASYPLIYTALQLLQWQDPPIPISRASHIIRSPFIAHATTELMPRATLDAALHDAGEYAFTESQLLHAANQHQALQWVKQIRMHQQQSQPSTELPSEWAVHFTACLQQWGWPGERALNSEEYQVLQRFHESLNEFAAFDTVITSCNITTALGHLQHLLYETLFQAQSHAAPIHILGLLEASGLSFNALWVMGLNANTWPAGVQPNPFIPLHLQREYQCPHADSQRELTFSQQLTQRLAHSAPEVIFSYAQREHDQTLQASPLIAAYPHQKNLPAIKPHHAAQLFEQREQQESYDDAIAPAVKPSESIQGGSFILKDQALCPFRAFAKHRLKAHALPTPHSGLDGLERGLILHQALDIIWHQLGDHHTLHEKTQDDLQRIINRAIRQSLADIKMQRPLFNTTLLDLEHERAYCIIQQWLDLEKERPPFTVVAQEAQRHIRIGPLNLSVRVDRIDEIADKQRIIIDYKTAISHIKNWFDEHLTEPQLPLYCVSEPEVAGIVFAQLRAEQLYFKGVSHSAIGINGIDTLDSWDEQLTLWKTQLEKLAYDFAEGKAQVAPAQALACQTCDLHSLCRVEALSL